MGFLKRLDERGARAAPGRVGLFLFGVLLAGIIPCSADGVSAGHGFQVKGEPLEQGENVSAGGAFRMTGKSVLPSNGIGKREFSLAPGNLKQRAETNGCPCQSLFSDGFESGGLGAWSGSSEINLSN